MKSNQIKLGIIVLILLTFVMITHALAAQIIIKNSDNAPYTVEYELWWLVFKSDHYYPLTSHEVITINMPFACSIGKITVQNAVYSKRNKIFYPGGLYLPDRSFTVTIQKSSEINISED
ncbi:MAG: hypothetical protein KKG99_02450 [Bacteroidetes bacterium]|nr:hypothetical protein [Bacteroidota bacterium]